MNGRAVFLDRDGVINAAVVRGGKPYPPATLDEFRLLPGVAEAVGTLKRAGFRVVVATNQPDVATGIQSLAVVEAIHDRLRSLLPVDAVRVCYHAEGGGCDCRKPRPGMLTAEARESSIDLARSYMVGDRWRDVGAGRAAGCATVLIGDGYGEPELMPPDVAFDTLAEAADWIVSRNETSRPE